MINCNYILSTLTSTVNHMFIQLNVHFLLLYYFEICGLTTPQQIRIRKEEEQVLLLMTTTSKNTSHSNTTSPTTLSKKTLTLFSHQFQIIIKFTTINFIIDCFFNLFFVGSDSLNSIFQQFPYISFYNSNHSTITITSPIVLSIINLLLT
ncbi:hypothetical protein PPL_07176 [Heterostelium album PN500]|uniref:Transmembrane protein n=1 Tax=Heterostelium pallidum (strain ATCC 26659 / Pp 5 / PN500) TaxID=670386 RepID=D3BEL2_HETP5|nr:hypothetical protein PPL_07176 [Heterostelium album PN500]EFA80343.1 hypothetical protein PPL_07176 [Heterostelium album PN500]|eukprot:XP_020432463.1 hypothetical protein PPL_07176 [Heterostelium album PN500]